MNSIKEVSRHRINLGFWDGFKFGLGFAMAWFMVYGIYSVISFFVILKVIGVSGAF